MANFRTERAADRYQARWCERCLHGVGCAVWEVHERARSIRDEDHLESLVMEEVADKLLPIGRGGRSQKCTMFAEQRKNP